MTGVFARRTGGVAGGETNEVALESGSGYLVVRQSHARGGQAWWTAPVPPSCARTASTWPFRCQGRHEVRFHYVPPGRAAGLVVTLLSLAGTAILVARAGHRGWPR